MRHGEEVTFGGSGLNRAAELRGDAGRMAELLSTGRVLPVWRGKPLVVAGTALGWVCADSPVLRDGARPVFLGLQEGGACFAQDISAWVPTLASDPTGSGFFDAQRQAHPALPEDHLLEDLRGVMASLSPRDAELAATAKAILQWHATHGYCSACGAATEIVKSGWQRSCSACSAQHFPRTDPVVIMLVVRGNDLLLGRNAAWPDGMYSLLAGFVEPGETLEAAVRREVHEETGVQVGRVRYLNSQPWPFPASLMFGCIAEATSAAITLDPVELEDALWISREDMVKVQAGLHPKIKPGRKGAIAQFLIRNWLADRLD